MVAAVALAAANDEDANACRREARRLRVLLKATVTTASAETPVVVRDISSTGALVASPIQPRVGSYVLFRREGVAVRAKVVRRDGKLLGLQFQEQIDEAQLLICIGGVSPLAAKH